MGHITLGHINIRSLNKHKHQIKQFLVDNNIDILTINETLLGPHCSPTFYGYTLHRQDNSANKYMGVAILARNTLASAIISSTTSNSFSKLTIAIKTDKNENIHITTIYNKTRHHIPDTHIANLASTPKHIITGDFNSRSIFFGDCRSTPHGDRLARQLARHSLNLINNGEPTRINNNHSTSILDLILTTPDMAQKISNFITHYELPSDHLALTCQIHTRPSPQTTSTHPAHRPKFNTTLADWTLFQHTADTLTTDTNLPNPNSHSDIESAIDSISGIIQKAASTAIPILHPKHFTEKLPASILKYIQQRKHFRRLYVKHKIPAYKTEANKLKSIITKQIREHKKNQWTLTCNNLERYADNPKKLHGVINTLTKARQRKNIPALLNPSNSRLAVTDDEKAQVFAKSLQSIHNKDFQNTGDLNNYHEINTCYNNLLKSLDPIAIDDHTPTDFHEPIQNNITITELKIILSRTKNTAPGPNRITYTMIKHLPESTLTYIVDILNTVLKTGYIPQCFKKSNVILFPKPNKSLTDPLNYRPIHLINIIPKLMDKIISTRIQHFLNINNKYNPNQSGFRTKHTTTDHPLHLHFIANTGFKKRQYTAAAFLDLSKAFDTVWLPGLIHKMQDLNIPLPLTRYTHNRLIDRTCTININNNIDHSYLPQSGVPQGSPLSPTLFNIYMNDIPTNDEVHTKLFADDIAVYTCHKHYLTANQRLQAHLSVITKFCHKWYLTINPSKTQHTYFHRKRNVNSLPSIKVLNIDIPPTHEITYLGFHLNRSLRPNTHIQKQAQKTYHISSKLHTLHGKLYGPSPALLSRLYKILVRPVLEYGNMLSADAPISQTHTLEKIQHSFLTKIHNTPRTTPKTYINTISGVQNIRERLKYLKARTLQKHHHLTGSPINRTITLTHSQPHINNKHPHLIPPHIPLITKYKHNHKWPPLPELSPP